MSVFKKKISVSIASLFLLVFFCYAIYPRPNIPVSGNGDSDFTLVIDAGHGGEDGGALSDSGVRESDLNLSVALRTEDLAALLGVKTVMVRNSDISIHDEGCQTISQKKNSDLRNRVRIVESISQPLLLSIHQNHFSEKKYRGAQVFYAKTEGSDVWAEKLQADLKILDEKNHRQYKPASKVYLMEHISCPAVLVECGFLSNPAEALLLEEANYQKKLAMTMLRAVAEQGKDVTEEREI